MGDYGKIDRQTGDFKRKGNIYEDMAELVKDYPPKPAPREDVFIAASAKVTRSEFNSSVKA